MKQKAIFFLRHYNDIDHIVPVIYKWCKVEDVPIEIIITSDRDKLNDYRITFLKQFNYIQLRFIDDLTLKDEALCNGLKTLNNKTLIDKMLNKIIEDIDNVIVIFDWVQDNMAQYVYFSLNVIANLIQRNIKFAIIALPHGDEPHFSKMIRRDDLDYNSSDIYSFGAVFDYVVVPNKLCANRYKPHLDLDRIKILGSPRFNDEWLSILSNLVPGYNNKKGKSKLKIAFFLRAFYYPLFWDEVVRTIRLIAQFKEVYLVVKHHTRDIRLEELINDYPDLNESPFSNVEIVFDDVHSSSLLQWADLVLDVGTSIGFECIKLNKPILSMEYLHAAFSTMAHYMKGTVMLCRDHLYDTIKLFIKDPHYQLYDEEERNRFIQELIDIGDSDVLSRYVHFLQASLKGDTVLTDAQEVARQKAIINRLVKEITIKDDIIAKKDDIIVKRDQRIMKIENTLSWKITKPLRSRLLYSLKDILR